MNPSEIHKQRGVIFWEDDSELDGQPLVAIATLRTRNPKTGPMIQTWIMRTDLSPTDAANTGADVSCCGSCSLRGQVVDGRNTHRGCYVRIGRAPTMVWQAYQRGSYGSCSPEELADYIREYDRPIRIGSYGDPAAVPQSTWDPIINVARRWTSYTHQWRSHPGISQHLMRSTMASVEGIHEARHAWALGWRTFRVIASVDERDRENEILCPASPEAGSLVTCDKCTLCTGAARGDTRSIAIVAHGGAVTRRNATLTVRDTD
jgi:hypothetical protein